MGDFSGFAQDNPFHRFEEKAEAEEGAPEGLRFLAVAEAGVPVRRCAKCVRLDRRRRNGSRPTRTKRYTRSLLPAIRRELRSPFQRRI